MVRKKKKKYKRPLSLKEAAAEFGYEPQYFKEKYITCNPQILKAYRPGGTGNWRIDRKVFEDFKDKELNKQ